MSSGIHKNIKKDRGALFEPQRVLIFNTFEGGHCLNAVSCAGVLADQRFAKTSMKIRFSAPLSFFCFYEYSIYISVM